MGNVFITRPICIETIGSVFTKRRGENYLFSGESHESWEMVYVIDGYVGVTAGERILKCRPGSLIFHQPNEFHRLWNAGKGDIHIMVISFTGSGDELNRLREKVLFLDETQVDIMRRLQDFIAEDDPKQRIKSARGAFAADPVTAAQFVSLYEYFLYTCAKSENTIKPKMTGDTLLFS